MIGDIDLLVPEKDYLKAARILEEDGYEKTSHNYQDINTLKHYPRLFKNDVPADVEVHRLIVPSQYGKLFNPDTIETKMKSVYDVMVCYVMTDKWKVIHNFIHSQLSNKGNISGIVTLRDIYDLYLLSKRTSVPTSL